MRTICGQLESGHAGEVTATAFLEQLDSLASAGERLRMGQIFGLAKEYVDMERDEIEKLLDGPSHEARSARSASWARRPRASGLPRLAATLPRCSSCTEA